MRIYQKDDTFVDEKNNIVKVRPIGTPDTIKSFKKDRIDYYDKFKSRYGAKNQEKKAVKHHCCSKKDKNYRTVTAYLLGECTKEPNKKGFIRAIPEYNVEIFLYEII